VKRSAYLVTVLSLSCLATLSLWFRRQSSTDVSHRSAASAQPTQSVLVPALTARGPGSKQPTALRSYGKLPLSFEANQGQADPRVKFLSHSGRMALLLTPDEALIAVAGSAPGPNRGDKGLSRPRLADETEKSQSSTAASASLLRMKLIGANPATEIRGIDELPGKSNYFIGRDPSKWRTNVTNYAQVAYREVYPGVDLSFYGHEQQVEYDFVVSPGSDPGAIRLGFSGARTIHVDGEGNLVLGLGKRREVFFHKPVVYQPAEERSGKEFLDGEYVLKAGNRVGFQVNGADPARSLIIDPVLSFATYLGGSGSDTPKAIAIDPSGNVYILGTTTSTDFPVTPGAFQTTYNSHEISTAFVTKMNATGTALVYSTFLGGTSDFTTAMTVSALAVDSSGNAYVTGAAGQDFPVTLGAYETTPPNNGNGGPFVAKLNASGSALVYSTFFVGVASSIAIDAEGNAYITGGIGSLSGLPVTAGAFQSTCGDDECGFVTKFNPAGSGLVYSTFLGGTSPTAVTESDGIAVDSSGSAYVFGSTGSTSFPVTPGAFESTFQGGDYDTFVAKFNPSGSALVYSTYLGGQDDDLANGIAVDTVGSAYVTGRTQSPNFPVTPGAFATQFTPGSSSNIVPFLAKLNPTGTGLSYSALFPGVVSVFNVGVDSVGDAFVAGWESTQNSPNFPIKDPLPGGGTATNNEAFVTEVNGAGTALIYSTLLGGNTQIVDAIAVDPAGDAYLTGTTGADLPVTQGAYQTSIKGTQNVFIAEIPAVQLPAIVLSPTSLTFPEEVIGSSTSQAVTLTNAGNGAMTINSIIITGDYSQTNTCPPATSTLGAGSNCTITVTFMPRATGTRTGQLTITDNESPSAHVVNLIGGSSSGVASLSKTSLAFGSQQVATTSAPQSVALKNTGTTPLNISSIVAAGDFAQTNTCGTSVAAGSSCSITVTFTPTTIGSRAGTVTISDTDPTGVQVISLSGMGFGPVVSLSSTTLAFGNQNVNTTSAVQLVTLSNTGDGPLSILSVSATGAFAQTNNCGSSVTAGANCTITVTFTPGANSTGNQTGTVSVTDNAAGNPQVIQLSGIGIGPFSLSSTSSTTQTATAGQTATYQMSVASNNGFAGTVSLTCGNAPPKATCSVPSSVTLTGNGKAAFTVSVATMANSFMTYDRRILPSLRGGPWSGLLTAFALLATILAIRLRTTRPRLALAGGAVLMLLFTAGCGGGGSGSSSPPTNTGTPAGTYTIHVTGSGQGTTQTMNVTLVVQ
jgi:centrosomal CEP192-like protein/beta-propeller repeat-containing protein/ASPM-SPD-2-Hydin domain-containing protein